MISYLCPLFVLSESVVPYVLLLQASGIFSLIVISMLLFIAFFLYQRKGLLQKKQQLRLLFSDLLAEMTICESERECHEVLNLFLQEYSRLLAESFARKILIREIVKTKDSISGGAAQNLNWLYQTLHLDEDTYKRFTSKKWHYKASAIQHLAEMQQEKYLVKIYRETNNKNSFIRTEAQIAVVKLTGFKGLRFLQIVSHPISQWQQLSLISQLKEGEIEADKISTWLLSANETVVEFALRLVEIYKCFELHDQVIATLQHASETVRLQALRALEEICHDSTAGLLIQHFPQAGKQEQLAILDLLPSLDTGTGEVSFLSSLLDHRHEAIRYRAIQAIQQISPAWSSVIIRQMQNNPADTYLLSTLEKKAV